MDKTLKQHEEMIDSHEVKLEDIQQNLVDIKVRLGLKDISNGNVIKYQEDLVKAQEQERQERKDHDAMLLSKIDKIDDKLWQIVAGMILMVLLEIVVVIVQAHI